MFENQPSGNQPTFPPQAPNPLGGAKPAEDIFAEVDRNGPRLANNQPVNFGPANFNPTPRPVAPTPAPTANPGSNQNIGQPTTRTLDQIPSQPQASGPMTFDQPPAKSHVVKYLLIGLGSLAVVLLGGIYLYQQVLKPRLEQAVLPLNEEQNQTADQINDEANTGNDQFILDEEPIINGNDLDANGVNNGNLLTEEELLNGLDNTNQVLSPIEPMAGSENVDTDFLGGTDFLDGVTPTTPTDVPVTADSDGDGLSDAEEQILGTNRLAVDSDSDGLSDKEEVKFYDTNPLDPDSDGDTYLDGQEVTAGYNPNGAGKLLVQ